MAEESLPGDRVIVSDAPVGALTFSADGTLLAGICEDHKVRFWNSRTGELKQAVSVSKEEAWAAMFADPADLLTPVKSGKPLAHYANPDPGLRRLVFSRDGKLLAGPTRAADGSENTVRVWNLSGTEQLALKAGLGGISALAFSPDGSMLVAAGYDTDLRAWSTRDGELLRVMDELPLTMFAAAFSPDGKYLATAGADRIVYLWDTKTWKMARKLSGQPEMISALVFSPDSKLLLTGGSGELNRDPVKALLWDIGSGRPVRSMTSAHMVLAAAFSPDGKLAATVTTDRNISIWAVPTRL